MLYYRCIAYYSFFYIYDAYSSVYLYRVPVDAVAGVQELHGLRAQARQVDDLQAVVAELTDLVQGVAMQEAHEPQEVFSLQKQSNSPIYSQLFY